MSKHDKIAKLKEYIKNFVIKELEKDEELEEVSTTVTAGGSQGTGIYYDTPKAFSSGSAVGHKSPEVGGYKKIKEDIDVGHQDDEPDMLKSTAMEIVDYGKKLYDALEKYDEMEDEVDFPNWWQSKLIVAKDYIQKAYHYLDSEEKKDGVQESITGSDRKELLKIGKEIKDNLIKHHSGLSGNERMLTQAIGSTFMSMGFSPDNKNYQNYKKYFPKNFNSSSVKKLAGILQKEKDTVRKTFFKQIVKESINESYSSIFIEISKAIKANRPDELNAIRDLADEYDIGRVLYMARTNPKALRKAVDDRVKERKQFIKGKTLKEVTKQEVNALRNLVKGIGNLKKDFSKATYIGDKELRKKDYNKHYETLLDAEKAMVKLMQLFKNKQMLGEGRYHDWRNDESLTPKQKIGRSIREVRNSLNELNKTINMNLKLKTELQVDSRDYWKTTHKALSGISEKLVKLAGKVGNLK